MGLRYLIGTDQPGDINRCYYGFNQRIREAENDLDVRQGNSAALRHYLKRSSEQGYGRAMLRHYKIREVSNIHLGVLIPIRR